MRAKLNLYIVLFSVLASVGLFLGCDKGGSADDGSAARAAQCVQNAKKLESIGLQKVKAGMDLVVAKIPQADVEVLILGAKVYRRAEPSKLYAREFAAKAIQDSVEVTKKIAVLLMNESLIATPISIPPVTEGFLGGLYQSFPKPPADRDRPEISLRDKYDGIPVFGVSLGETAADAGFALVGEITTKIDAIYYNLRLKYTAVAKSYILDSYAYQSESVRVGFSVSECSAGAEYRPWVLMPREQANVAECEFKNCKNIPRD